ncbi:basic proline-rich protein-like [Sus scrofa]|uniref:basic proline-rich protein-like n=1 Tax=Sus scrofa TaxID=9823 RepID=UPI000A2AFFFA|nr:basic proline-rich protein-like [Sus scrofa]
MRIWCFKAKSGPKEASPLLSRGLPPGAGARGGRAVGGAVRPLPAQGKFRGFISGRGRPGPPTALPGRAAANTPPGICTRRVAPPPRAAATNTPPPPARHRPRRTLTPRSPPPGSGEEAGPGGGVVASPPGSARADARLVYRPAPPARPRPQRRAYPEQPRAGRSLVGRGCGGRGGGGKGVTAAAAGQVRPGRGRRRGGAGLRPGPRLSAPSRLRSSGRWSGRRRAGPGGGGGRAEDSSLTHPTCLSAPPPPSPTTGCRAAAAGAPEAAGRASAETTAPSLPRALPPLAPPPPPPPPARPRAGALTTVPYYPSPTPPPATLRPVGSEAPTAAARRSSWRDPDVVGQELQRALANGGGVQLRPDRGLAAAALRHACCQATARSLSLKPPHFRSHPCPSDLGRPTQTWDLTTGSNNITKRSLAGCFFKEPPNHPISWRLEFLRVR